MQMEWIIFFIPWFLRFFPMREEGGFVPAGRSGNRLDSLQGLGVEFKFFRWSLKNTVPFSKIINRVPPSPFLLKRFPELLKAFIGRGPPSSFLKKTGPGLIELEAKEVAPFCIKDTFETMD